jgi:glycolate oxidase FAD binding subunit
VKPRDEKELAEAVHAAQGPLCVIGGGTRRMAGPGEELCTGGLSGITLYEPGALTLVAQAGTPLADIEAALQAENQRLAFEPMDHRPLLGTSGTPTIGGVFAGNVSGPRRLVAGAARDFLLGVRFVDGRGRVIKNGGRVMKNVTGYDLVKLMAGSCGTLGVLSEVSLKVLPRPETQATLTLRRLDGGAGVAAMAQAMRSPFEVSGAAHVPRDGGSEAGTHLRLEGFEKSVRYRMGQLRNLLSGPGVEIDEVGADQSEHLWQRLRDAGPLLGQAGDVWRVACKPSDGPRLVARSGATTWFYDWAGGLVWLLTPKGHDLRSALAPFQGHATYVRGHEKDRARLGRTQPEASGVARLTDGIRAQFDPFGRFTSTHLGKTA